MRRFFRSLSRVISVSTFLAWWTVRGWWTRPRAGADAAATEEWRRTFFAGACRGILERLGVRVQTRGEFPAAGGILVTNHLGYLDVLVLASLGPAIFVSRADVEGWPFVGPLTRWCATIYIDRERREQIPHVVAQMEAAAGTGSQVIFFPEGTSGSGDGLLPFRPSLFAAAAGSGLPVRVAVLGYRTPPGEPSAREAVCWWGDAGFARHFFGLAGLEGTVATVEFVDRVFHSSDRKRLAHDCEEEIGRRFRPVTGSEAAR